MSLNKTGANLLAYNSVLNFIGQIIPLLFGLIAIPITIKGLGIDAFGILSLAWVALGYFSLFDLGLSRATTKYVSECLGSGEVQTIPQMVWTSTGLQVLLGIAGGGLCIVFVPFLVNNILNIPAELLKNATITFYIIAASLPVVLLSTGLRGVLEASQRFDLVNLIKIPSNALVFIIPAVVVSLGYHLPEIVLFLIIVRVITIVFYLYFCFKIFPDLRSSVVFEIKIVKKLLNYGSWITISAVVGPLVNYVERFFIASLLSVGKLGFYTAPYEIASRVTIFSNSMAATLFPAFSHYDACKPSNLEELFLRAIKCLAILIIPIAIVLYIFADEILTLWLGVSIAQNSAVVFQILIFAFLVNSLAVIPYIAVQGLGRADIKAKFDIIEAVVFIALIWMVISDRGINGVALAKLAVTFLDIILLIWASHRLIRFSAEGLRRYKITHTAVIILFFGLTIFILQSFFNKILLLIFVMCGSCIYALVMWQFALDEKDKITIRSIKKSWMK